MEYAGVPIQAEASCCQNITETFYCLKTRNGNGKKYRVVAIICSFVLRNRWKVAKFTLRLYVTNGIFQMQGGKNRILPK
jgi:hypothetical protein